MRGNHARCGAFLAAAFLVIGIALAAAGCGRRGEDDLILAEDPAMAGSSGTGDEAGTGDTCSGEDPEEEPVCVFVCGAVMEEGVYSLPEGSRVIDAVEAAGGYREDADPSYVNQADYVSDAQKLVIPTREEVKALEEQAPVRAGEEDAGDGLVNLNTADESQLQTLPGVGPARARSIIAYREENGPFQDPSEITKVSGIGQASYEKMKAYITAP